jgi:tRNA A22 N-methylase
METQEISRFAALILKRKQNNFNKYWNKKMFNNTSFDDNIKEIQDKNGILDKKKRKVNNSVVKLTNKDRTIGFYA